MKVTVKSSMPTGKEDAKFGAEYYVQFNEIADSASFWFKKQPETDQPMDIEQVNGKWKKIKKEWQPSSAPSQPSSSSPSGQPSAKPAWKDNTDGIRQGMWINNAANFVNNQIHDKVPTADQWAKAVHEYASAGYNLGELNAIQITEEVPKDVASLFNGAN